MNSSRRDFLLRSGLVYLGGTGLLISACGGGGGGTSSFPSAGTRSFEGTVQAGFSVTDPQTGCKLNVPTGAMNPSSKVQLTVWSGQRELASRSGFDVSERAFDLTINPAELIGQSTIEVGLPWKQGGSLTTTSVVAYGANGRSLVLRDAPDSKPEFPIALIGSHELHYLANMSTGSSASVVIQIAVAEPSASRTLSTRSVVPTLSEIWSRPKSRTSYASRQRVAIVTHGILDDAAGQAPVMNYMKGKFPTEGDNGSTFPFDKVATFGYDWMQQIQSNGARFASEINASYGDPDKYEVFIFAHSMGGLVSRCAVELSGTPSVKQLVTLGTPHLGVPLTVMKNLVWLNLGLSLAAPGVKQLLEDSDVVQALRGSRANNVEYKAMAGISHSDFKGGLGDAIDVVYTVLNLKSIDHDGIVPESSALGGPAVTTASVSLNHTLLVDRIASYWTGSAGSWVTGLNRTIHEIILTPTTAVVTEGQSITLKARLLDKDSDVLDQTLIPGLEFEWTVADANVASVENGVVSGKKAGSVLVTLRERQSGVTANKLVTVTLSAQSSPPFTIADYKRQMKDINGQFKMGRTEVTVGMWREYCQIFGKLMPPTPSWGWIDTHPIVNVSWNDCKAYADWAALRLPTGAEWQLAASGGDGRWFPWGQDWDPSKCVNSDSNPRRSSTSPVGTLPAGDSPFGCSDMSGNAFEWCANDYEDGKEMRGATWIDSNGYLFRCDTRHWDFPESIGVTYPSYGFRLAGPV